MNTPYERRDFRPIAHEEELYVNDFRPVPSLLPEETVDSLGGGGVAAPKESAAVVVPQTAEEKHPSEKGSDADADKVESTKQDGKTEQPAKKPTPKSSSPQGPKIPSPPSPTA